jgi:hypothetical protein
MMAMVVMMAALVTVRVGHEKGTADDHGGYNRQDFFHRGAFE